MAACFPKGYSHPHSFWFTESAMLPEKLLARLPLSCQASQ